MKIIIFLLIFLSLGCSHFPRSKNLTTATQPNWIKQSDQIAEAIWDCVEKM